MRSKILGYSFAIFTIMMWSLNIIYSKYLAGVLTPSEISFYRWAIGFFVFLPFVIKSFLENFAKIIKYWYLIFYLALTGIGFQNWFIYVAGETADAMTMSLISVSGPIFLIILSRQRINIQKFLGILLAIGGVTAIILKGNFRNIYSVQLVAGDVYMLGSSLMFAIYAVLQKKMPRDIPSVDLLFSAIAVALIMFLFPSLPELTEIHIKQISKLTMFIVVILGVFNSALAYLSWDGAIKRLGAVDAGVMYYLMPIFSIFFAYVMLGEKICESQIFGAIMIIVGVFLVVFNKKKIDNEARKT